MDPSGHYVVLRGYDDMGTPNVNDDIFYINDPYNGVENKDYSMINFLVLVHGIVVLIYQDQDGLKH